MGCKILLADDSITIQKVVNLTFDDEGIDVVAVSNGDQAERKLSEVNPDLVLADIFMPGKNGYELCEAIKKNPQFSNVPVVLLVGAFEPFDQNEARRVGADDHLTKPFESRKLVETVRRLISMREQTRPQPTAEATPQASAQEQVEDRTTDSLEDRSERTTDPLDAKPLVQSFNLDLSNAPDQAPAVESAETDQNITGRASDVTALNENAPLELDYSPPAQAQIEPAADADFHFTPPERTGDLSTASLQEEIAFETTPLEDLEFPVSHQPSEVMVETDDDDDQEGRTAEPRAWDESDAPHAFGFGEDTPDFDKLDEGEPPLSETVFAVDVDARDSAEPSPSEWASDKSAWQPSLHESSRVDATGGSPYMASEAGETASATLLAVEDPLGDVLMDEETPQQARWQPTETTEGAVLNLDFSSPEAALLPPISEVAPEYAESHPEESSTLTERRADREVSFAEPVPALDQLSQDPAVDRPAVEPELVFNPENDFQTQSSSDFASVQTQEPQREEASQTDRAQSHYDFSQVSEPGFETISNEAEGFETATDERMPAPVEEFTSSAMWTEEESRFAPIDIEAVPVDEAGSHAHPIEQETGFEFSQIITEGPDTSPDYLPATEPESEPAVASQPESQVVGLAPSAIDEIVRRVVAELSDRVVREIAWEVVPDLVERVVEKLARESISKRT
jgi:CheY-like chemotaxis protein